MIFKRLGLTLCLAAATLLPVLPSEASLPSDPALLRGTLDNGFRYAILPNGEPPDRISIRLYVNVGSLQEREEERGLAHFVEHMAFNGTTHFAPGDMVTYFQRLGMAFGPDTNAYTGFDQTVYILEMPRNEEALLRDGLRLLRDYADGMLMLEEEIESERGVIINEKRFRDTVGFRIFQQIYAQLLPETLIPHRWPIGTEEVIRGAERQTFVDFYDAWYRPERMALVIVGDVDPGEIARLVRDHFSDFEARAPAREALPIGPVETNGLRFAFHREPEATSTDLYILRTRPDPLQEDTDAYRIEDLKRSIAFDLINRRLARLSRAEEPAFLGASAFSNSFPGDIRVSGLNATLNPETLETSLSALEQSLRQTLQYGFTDAEVRRSLARLEAALRQNVEAAPTRLSSDLADNLLEAVRFDRRFTTPEQDLALFESARELLTAEAILSVFSREFSEDEALVMLVGADPLEDAEIILAGLWSASLTAAVAPPGEDSEMVFAYESFGVPGTIVSRTVHADLGITQVRFSNGLRLNYKQTDFDQGQIQMRFDVGRGLLDLPEGFLAFATLAEFSFEEGGLGEHPLDEIEEIFAGQTVSLNFAVGPKSVVLSGESEPAFLRSQLNLLTAYVVDPALRETALNRARNLFPIVRRQSETTLEGVFRSEVRRFLAGGDPSIGLPTIEEFGLLSRDDLGSWIAPLLLYGFGELSVVGDFDPEALENEVAATLGSLPDRMPWYSLSGLNLFREVPFSEEPVIFPYPTDLNRSASLVVWPLTDGRDTPLNRRFEIIRSILQDRLRIRVREEMGDTYGVQSAITLSDVHPGWGYLLTITMTEPDRVEAVESAKIEVMQSLLAEGITEDEFERALAPFQARLIRDLRSNGYWLNTVLQGSTLDPFQLEMVRNRQEDVESITPEELTDISRIFLDSVPTRIRIVPVSEREP